MNKIYSISIALLFLAAHAYAEEINSGSYTLKLDIPAMAEGKKKTELHGKLTSKKDGFTFKTKGASGNSVTIRGQLIDERVVMWVTRVERGGLVTFHYTGKLSKAGGNAATGELSLFSSHEKIASGKWKLVSKE